MGMVLFLPAIFLYAEKLYNDSTQQETKCINNKIQSLV